MASPIVSQLSLGLLRRRGLPEPDEPGRGGAPFVYVCAKRYFTRTMLRKSFGRIRARTRPARRYLYIGTEFPRMRYISGSGARALRLDRVARSLVLMVFNGVA